MARVLKLSLLACQFLCPLLFFTDLTRNPYFTQIALLNAALLAAVAAYLMEGALREGSWRLPRTPLDAPLACWILLCAGTWAWAYTHHVRFFRPAIAAEGLRCGVFLVVNTLAPYYLAAACVREAPAQPGFSPVPWALFALAWGASWGLFPQLRTGPGSALDVWGRVWDPYGGLLWAGGFAVVAYLARGGSLHHFWHAALAAGFFGSAYGVLQYFGVEWVWPKVLNPYGGRAVSTFGNPNFLSSYLVLLLPVALAYYLKARARGARFVYACAFLAMEAALVSSLTRSSWAGALAALGVLALSKDLRRCAKENLESHGVVASLAVAMVLFWPQSSVGGFTPSVFGRVRELGLASDLAAAAPYSPLYQRVLIWSGAWLMGHENPLWGKGYGLFELFYPFYQGHVLATFDFFRTLRTHANNAHNEAIEVFAQTGILGVGVQLWLWAAFFAAAWSWLKTREEGARPGSAAWLHAAASGVAGMLVDNLLNVSLHFAVPAFLFWWQAGAVMGRQAHEEGRWRRLRLPGRSAARGAALAAAAVCAAGGWWWLCQWNREVRYFMGFKLLRGGRVAQAIEQLEKAYRWHSREVNGDYELGNAYAAARLFPKAEWAYREALKSNAGYDEIYFNLATVQYKQLGRPEEAFKNYRTSHWINPLSLDLYDGLSVFYLREPRRYLEEATEFLERGLRFYPDNPNLLNNLGYLYRVGKRRDEAEAALTKALRLNPDMKLAEFNLGELAKESGRRPAVLGRLAALRELDARVARQDYSKETLDLARKAVAWFPEGARGRFYLGSLEMMHGRPEEALRLLEPLAAAETRNGPLQRNLGEIYLRLGRPRDAARAYQSALAASPGDAALIERLTRLGSPP